MVARAGRGRGGAGQGLFSHLKVEEQRGRCPKELEGPWSSELSPQLLAGTCALLSLPL